MSNKSENEHRPWGYYSVLSEEEDHKVKRIVVYPGKRISLQKHQQRAEHWFIISGDGIVTLDGKQFNKKRGESIEISQGSIHRIENIGETNLRLVEVQTGDYFGEDDIERFEDDFGRN